MISKFEVVHTLLSTPSISDRIGVLEQGDCGTRRMYIIAKGEECTNKYKQCAIDICFKGRNGIFLQWRPISRPTGTGIRLLTELRSL